VGGFQLSLTRPRVRGLLQLLSRSLHGRQNFTEEINDLRKLVSSQVSGLSALARTNAELDAIILVQTNGSVQHINRRENLGRAIQTIDGVAVQSVDHRREVGHGDLLRARALTASESHADNRRASVIDADFDSVAGNGDGGGIDAMIESKGSDLLAVPAEGTDPRCPHQNTNPVG
jgi:hypothetical protein